MTSDAAPQSLQDYISPSVWKTHSYAISNSNPKSLMRPGKASPMQTAFTQLRLIDAALPFSSATSVLDIACGPGTVYKCLFDLSPSLSVPASCALLATDISAPMIAHITARQSDPLPGDEGTWSRINAWVADATDLSIVSDGSQSHVISQMGIFLIPDSDAALREVKRVMRKDGNAVFSMSSVAETTWNSDVMGVIEEMWPERRMPRVNAKWRDVDSFRGELERNGFSKVEIHEVKMAMGFDDERELVEGLWKALPFMKSLTEGMTEEDMSRTKDVMVERVKERFPEKELPGKALVAVAFL
ncbi:hypothetical protein CAC42_1767 [Sphaceloma murrayae]|uniref:Methyltransferase domain-containing protein n=1 Tax=Sphaceloma murrayae TaxID=2082308 RepID=A0A2K1QVE5_9PEZI|nr:hypothetical protein CAC42_1767 [Sphaceloma murrayae]